MWTGVNGKQVQLTSRRARNRNLSRHEVGMEANADSTHRSAKIGSSKRVDKFESADKVTASADKDVSP